jgi:arylsulfatase A-like enzyme
LTTRPNFLLITSDQHRWDCFGFEGRRIKTPHLDRMAESGTRFGAAVTPSLVCQPARASMLTGLLPLSHGVYDNNVSLDPEVGEMGWARTLANDGYRSALIGKAHFGDHPECTPYGAPESRDQSANFPADWSGPYMGFDHMELMILGHWHDLLPCEKPPRGHQFERWFWEHGRAGEAWELWQQDFGPAPEAAQTWFSKLPAAWHSTTWVTERTIEFLEQAGDEAPFCLWASYPDPHHPFDCPEPWSRLHLEDDVDISRSHRRDLDRRPWWHRASLENEPTARHQWQKTLRMEYSRIQPQTDRQLRQMTANYYGEIAFIDDGVGRILKSLEKTGLAENTIVIFTTDHGDLLGDHGLYLKGPTPYEALLRVGMIVKGPDIPAGKVIDMPVSTLDLAASFYDWAGVSRPEDIQSRSLRPLIEGDGGEVREVAYSEWNQQPSRTGVELELRTVRTKTAKLTLELISGAGEMYDLAEDPDEMHNLFDDPGKGALVKELTDMIHARPGYILEDMPAHEA